MQVRINGQPVRWPGDVAALVPETAGTAPWSIVLDAGNGLRLEALQRDDGRFDIAYVETKQRHRGAPLERGAFLAVLRSFAAREPHWRYAGGWILDRDERKPQTALPPRRSVERRPAREQRHATIAGIVVLGVTFLFVALQIFGIKIRIPSVTLPSPLDSIGAKMALAAFLLVWVLLAFAVGYKLWEVRRARSWKRASGVITASDIGLDVSEPPDGVRDVRRVARVTYRFTAGNRSIDGTRLDMAERPPAISQEELTRRYPIGKVVSVYYDPAEPETCVLDRELPGGAAKGCLVATVVAIPLLILGMMLMTAGPDWVRAVLPNSQPHVFLIALVAGLVTALYAWREHVRRRRARLWPCVEGVVVTSEIGERGSDSDDTARKFVPSIVYRYTVAGETYHNAQIRLGVEHGGSRAYAGKLLAPYAIGTSVIVHYDPSNPQDAALEWDETVPKVAGVAAAVLLAVAVFAAG